MRRNVRRVVVGRTDTQRLEYFYNYDTLFTPGARVRRKSSKLIGFARWLQLATEPIYDVVRRDLNYTPIRREKRVGF